MPQFNYYMFKKNELKLLSPFYAQSLIFNLSKVIMPFYVLYFLSIGFSFFQIALISGIRSVVSLVFEIPTGVIADKYGRKLSVILGYFLTAVSLALVPIWDKFYIVAIIFAFNAFFETLISGADRAWPVDLIENTDKSLLDKYFLKTRIFRNVGMIVAPLIAGGIVAVSSMKNLWFVFAAGIIFSTLILFWGKELRQRRDRPKTSPKEQFGELIRDSKEAIKYALKNSIIILLFLGIFVFYFIDEITSLIWTPYLQKSGLNLPVIGYLFSIIAALGIILPAITQFLLKKRSKLFILFFAALGYSVLLFAAGKTNFALFIAILFVLFSSIDEIFLPLEESLTNEFIGSKHRAAVLSMKSMTESLASIIGAPVAGLLLGLITEKQAFMLSGFLILILPIIYFLVRRKKNSLKMEKGQE